MGTTSGPERRGERCLGGMVASESVCLFLECAVRFQALVGDIVLCSWARHLTLTVPLSTQVYMYKWVLVNCWGNLTNCRGVTCDGLAFRPGEGGGVKILQATSCFRNHDKLWQLQLYKPFDSKASLFFRERCVLKWEAKKCSVWDLYSM